MQDSTQPSMNDPVFNRTFGMVLLAGAVGTVFFMAHHPTSFAQTGGLPGMVHGLMLLMLLLLTCGFSHFALTLGLNRTLVLTGLLSYLAGAIFNALAAVINGFVGPALAARDDPKISHEIFDLTWEINQALAAIAVVASGLAYVLWSTDLLRRRWFWTAGLGFVAGLSPLLMLLASDGAMGLSTAIAVYSTQVIWAAWIGILMWRKRQSLT